MTPRIPKLPSQGSFWSLKTAAGEGKQLRGWEEILISSASHPEPSTSVSISSVPKTLKYLPASWTYFFFNVLNYFRTASIQIRYIRKAFITKIVF